MQTTIAASDAVHTCSGTAAARRRGIWNARSRRPHADAIHLRLDDKNAIRLKYQAIWLRQRYFLLSLPRIKYLIKQKDENEKGYSSGKLSFSGVQGHVERPRVFVQVRRFDKRDHRSERRNLSRIQDGNL